MIGMIGLVVSGSVYVGYTLNPSQDNLALIDEWKSDVHRHQIQLNHIREEADADVDALSSRIGLLQAHVMRLDALGRKLVKMARIDKSEFDFENTPALGGPERKLAERSATQWPPNRERLDFFLLRHAHPSAFGAS